MKIKNIFKKTHRRLVYGSRLIVVIDILEELNIEVTGVKKYGTVKMTEDIEDTLYAISYKADNDEELNVMFELYRDPQIGGACSKY